MLCVAAAFTVVRDPGGCAPSSRSRCWASRWPRVYAVAGAPDVALVAVLVETIFTLVFVGVFSRLPQPRRRRARGARGRRNVLAGIVAGVGVVRRDLGDAVADEPGDAATRPSRSRGRRDAHGGDVVTVILADFRGLDTMVEITVLAVAVVGVASLLRRGRSW